MATKYAADYDLQPRGDSESPEVFRARIAQSLRDKWRVVEAYEALFNHRADGNTFAGRIILGLTIAALSRISNGDESTFMTDDMAMFVDSVLSMQG